MRLDAALGVARGLCCRCVLCGGVPRAVPILGKQQAMRVARNNRRALRALGVTLLELLISVTLIGVLSAVAVPSYRAYMERARIAAAKKDILEISLKLERYVNFKHVFPASLADLPDNRLDPWGNPYRYLSMEGANVGQKRKDKSLHPLNSDYDLYSMGPDGQSQTPLTAKASRDDIIRANNGGFVGVAEDY